MFCLIPPLIYSLTMCVTNNSVSLIDNIFANVRCENESCVIIKNNKSADVLHLLYDKMVTKTKS